MVFHVPVWTEIRSQLAVTGSTLCWSNQPCESDPRGVEVYADPMIITVFFNLLDNVPPAWSACYRIRVFVQGIGRHPVDHLGGYGIGIPDRKSPLIFKRDFGKHPGLGLFLSRGSPCNNRHYHHRKRGARKGARFEIRVPKGKYRFSGFIS